MKTFAFIFVISLISLTIPITAGPVGSPNDWLEQPSDLTDLSQFPDHLFEVSGRPVPAEIIQAYGLEFTPDDTTGAAIFENNNPSAEWTTKCETTEGSPVGWHLQVAIHWLRQRGQVQCLQWKNRGSSCTELIGFQTARIGICAEYHYWLWCDSAAGFTQSIFDQCLNWMGGNNRAGGYTIIRGWPGSPGFRGMVVY
ncbi:hypothetical protein C7212DRAFT_328287 [Tuber magnatum]|uniref:Uncharacterized protein n=1 Tax=Tuber magnatum TaxID=42249 RepID=A0A317SIB6_9PEZI|nr:hypothetical protein C7212DRAFT_328287 [Tuber magnatum]